MKKYKTWWLVCYSISAFCLLNWTSYGLFGLSLIASSNVNQMAVQFFVGFISTFAAFVGSTENYHIKEVY